MAAIARSLALSLAVLSAAAAALIVLPAPSLTLALAAIVASEKSALIIGGALVALALCLTAAAPRTLLAHGGRDQFLDHAHMDLLAARLVVAGIPHQTLFIPYAQHAFDFLPGSFSSQILEATLLNFLGVGAP
jgi:acetyl esterase/lipase